MKNYIYYYTILHESIDYIILDLINKTIIIINNKKEMNSVETDSSLVSE